jgi:hypothetical protein
VGKGEFEISMRLAKIHSSHCGWVMKQASQMISLGGSQFKPRFLVLLEGVLTYYDNEHSLEHPRGTMKCSDIIFMNYGPSKNGEMTLAIQSDTEDWYIHWMEDEAQATKDAWLRKIMFCSPNIKDRETLQLRATSMAGNGPSSPLPTVEVKATGKLNKRASFLFGGKK